MALGLGVSFAIVLNGSTPSAYLVKNLTFVFLAMGSVVVPNIV